ncbi:MAG: polysaccharide deacetylase family protein [Patescibacteria group bacterium]|nr:polysaccharide deacetylase family protein [Patescibacteria group bacterium]
MKGAKIKKRKKIKNAIQTEGKHSFIFWIIVPIVMVWLSMGYITGLIFDKPFWLNQSNAAQKTDAVIPYYKEHGSFAENLNQPFISIWFDDAWKSQYLTAFPILKNKGFSGVVAIPINAVEGVDYMNWGQLIVLQKNGWETTNHSLKHDCEMQKWDRSSIVSEYKNSKFILWKNNLASDIFVTPCGVDSSVMREEAEKMFVAYRTVDPGFNDPKNIDFYNLKVKNIDNKTDFNTVKSWIDEAKSSNLWLILVFHKVGEKGILSEDDNYNTSKKEFEDIVNYIEVSNIKVVVPRQIIASQNL